VKKIIILLTALVLISTSAAADLNFGGSFELMAEMAKGETWNDNEPRTSLERNMDITLFAATEDGTFSIKGALLRNTNFWVYAWWRPIDIFMIKIGAIFEDSTWATGMDMEALHGNKFKVRPSDDFAGGILGDGTGFFTHEMNDSSGQKERALQLSFYPLKGLTINLGFPMDLSDFKNLAEYNYIYKLHAQAVYEIDGLGEAAVSFINAIDEADKFKQIFAQWRMPLGDSMKLELGLNLGLSPESTAPLNVGLGFGWGDLNEEQLGLNVRVAASIPMEETQDTRIGLDLLPSYDLGILRLYVPFGIGLNLPAADNVDSSFYWSANPYVAKKLGGPFFYAGFRIYKTTVGDGMDWSIPLGFRWDF
jgi:hypothetical protein